MFTQRELNVLHEALMRFITEKGVGERNEDWKGEVASGLIDRFREILKERRDMQQSIDDLMGVGGQE